MKNIKAVLTLKIHQHHPWSTVADLSSSALLYYHCAVLSSDAGHEWPLDTHLAECNTLLVIHAIQDPTDIATTP